MDPLSLPLMVAAGVALLAGLLVRIFFPAAAFDRRVRRTLLAVPTFGIALAGCASAPPENCASLTCIKQAAVRPIYEECVRDLLFQDRMSQRDRLRVADTYGYPYTNASTYFGLTGGTMAAAAPVNWCRHYADRHAQVAVASTGP